MSTVYVVRRPDGRIHYIAGYKVGAPKGWTVTAMDGRLADLKTLTEGRAPEPELDLFSAAGVTA